MRLRILHFSDLHIGLRFASYAEVAPTLVEARFDCLARLVRLANEQACDLVVVAGDLFDRVTVPKSDVVRAAEILADFEGPLVAVLPGNHDYVDPNRGAPWTWFEERAADNLVVLDRPAPLDLTERGLPAVLWPCPCSAKHSRRNALGWIAGHERPSASAHHIGVAHGSLAGISPDFAQSYYPMRAEELAALPIDLWLLGHTHVRYPPTPGLEDRIYFAGTPEPDGFDCDHEGTAWIHELDERAALRSTPLSTGSCRFRHEELELEQASDLAAIAASYDAPGSERLLLKLKVTGRLADEDYPKLATLATSIAKPLLWLSFDDSAVTRQITGSDIDARFTEGSFPHRLLRKLAQHDADRDALQEAYRIVEQVRR